MADQLRSRGPDGEGFHLESEVGIGMRRLSIIDLQGGWQPLYNEDRSLALVANGEIYNYVELRAELERRGHRFATASDCETIIHLYEEFGNDCVKSLRGMFAFAIIDRRNRRLLVARDRLGEKPLAFVQDRDRFSFCSEIGGLLAGGVVDFELDAAAIVDYFHWHFIPEPRSAVKGVRKLDAGSRLVVDLDSGVVREERYWRLEDAPRCDGDPVELIRDEIEQVSKIVTRSDVPIGVGLSGGIDSSAIVSLAKRYSERPVTAFTIGYEGRAWQDERSMAREFASYAGVRHVELQLETGAVVAGFGEMCKLRDDPLVDISSSGFLALYRLAHQHGVKVMLAGQGSDEIFWGYEWFRRAVRATRRKANLMAGQRGLLPYLEFRRPPLSLAGMADWVEEGGGLLRGLADWRRDRGAPSERLVFWDERREYRVSDRVLMSLAGSALADAKWDPAACFSGPELWTDVDSSMTALLCATFLQSNGLVMCDRLSMACGVEGRLPFADYRLAELVVGLRKSHGDLATSHKAWLTGALRGEVPEFVFRRKKRGFTPPWRAWTREIARRYGPDLHDGELVARGILADSAPVRLTSTVGQSLRPDPTVFSSILLEQWCRGMAEHAHRGRELRGLAASGADPVLKNSRSGGSASINAPERR